MQTSKRRRGRPVDPNTWAKLEAEGARERKRIEAVTGKWGELDKQIAVRVSGAMYAWIQNEVTKQRVERPGSHVVAADVVREAIAQSMLRQASEGRKS